uniref:Uncharacterized protein n=1 Tax=Rhizophora mucronata TaxID=61149 RepID=A0A2P2J2L2_RHIMU
MHGKKENNLMKLVFRF